jgi:hypothetical protein
MLFLTDKKNKIIFGWSAKCGCSHIKKLFYFLAEDKILDEDYIHKDYKNNIPKNIDAYTTVLFIRNPYKRIVSGFLDKYKVNGKLRKLWKYDIITFTSFIDELLKKNWNSNDYYHHFTLQTSEHFDENIIIKSKKLILYDIENIDYKYIEKIYNKKIPETLLKFRGKHIRNVYEKMFESNVYDLDMNIYYEYNVPIKYFYNDEIKKKIDNFYSNDFLFFKKYGFNYELISL